MNQNKLQNLGTDRIKERIATVLNVDLKSATFEFENVILAVSAFISLPLRVFNLNGLSFN